MLMMGNSSTDNRAFHAHAPESPVYRNLQVYAFDPSLDLDLETARVNRSTIPVAWEEDLQPGPVGEYLEVVDIDPPSGCVYAPVDLNDQHLLATDGLAPSAGSPQFHQQMVYAVAMKTIDNFEKALGRRVHWSSRVVRDEQGNWLTADQSYVGRLRIHPHATREANAYYSPDKKALLFGYFNAQNEDAREGLPGGMVFTCLSHDVIAHETTHAILDGIHRRMLEATNPDVLAFHEAFADLVAIFQHFTLPDVLTNQITQTRGDLATENLLGKLAVQFGHATNRGGALRDAIGAEDSSGQWRRGDRDPRRLGRTFEPHARGAILVAAVFDAFLTIYRAHTADLLRIASSGTGVLPEGRLHPDLVSRLAREAETVAERILKICIRALDYLPPVDVTFGDYLRAMITIDADLVPEDKRHYRTAIISAFRDHGIYPRDVRTLSVESLRWKPPSPPQQELLVRLLPPVEVLRFMAYANDYADNAGETETKGVGHVIEVIKESKRMMAAYSDPGRPSRTKQEMPLFPEAAKEEEAAQREENSQETPNGIQRRNEFRRERQFAAYLHNVLYTRARSLSADQQKELRWLLGVDVLSKSLKFEVQAVRPAVRVRGDGRPKLELLVLITQRDLQTTDSSYGRLHYKFRSGCTLLINPDNGKVSYAICKGIEAPERRKRQEQFLNKRLQVEGRDARARYSAWFDGEKKVPQEPFQMLHQGRAGEKWL